MYPLNKQAIDGKQQYDILSKALFRKRKFTDPRWQTVDLEATSPVSKGWKCLVSTRHRGDALEISTNVSDTPCTRRWLSDVYSGLVGTIALAYSDRSIPSADTVNSLLPAIRCVRKQTRVEWKFDNNYCSRYQWDCHSPPRCSTRRPTVESRRREGRACGVHKFRYTALRRSQIG